MAALSENRSSAMYRKTWMPSAPDTRQAGSYSGCFLVGGVSAVNFLENPWE